MFDERCPDGSRCPWKNLPQHMRWFTPNCKPGECLRESEKAATAEFISELAKEKGIPPASQTANTPKAVT